MVIHISIFFFVLLIRIFFFWFLFLLLGFLVTFLLLYCLHLFSSTLLHRPYYICAPCSFSKTLFTLIFYDNCNLNWHRHKLCHSCNNNTDKVFEIKRKRKKLSEKKLAQFVFLVSTWFDGIFIHATHRKYRAFNLIPFAWFISQMKFVSTNA